MNKRKFLLYLPISSLFVRIWMIFVLPKIGNYRPLYRFDHSRFHHFEIGIGLLVSALLVSHFRNLKKYTLLLSVAGGALVLDEYIFVLRIFGLRPAYRYLSFEDTATLLILLAVIFAFYLLRKKRA